MRYITGIILLALSLSNQSFSAEKPVYVGRTSQLLPDDLKHVKLSSTFHSSEAEAKLIHSQEGKWCFSFDTPVDLYVIIRRKSSSLDGVSEQKHKISRSASPMHDFMLARGVFRAEILLADDSTIKRYREDFSFYDYQDELTKETTTDRSGIFYARSTMTTSYGMGLSGSYPRTFNKPMEDEKDVSIDHVFSQDIKVSIGEECQIYRTYKKDNEFISISILFKQPEEQSLNQQVEPTPTTPSPFQSPSMGGLKRTVKALSPYKLSFRFMATKDLTTETTIQ